MLKLERDKQTKQVTIHARKGESLFTNIFVAALIAALSLHLSFFLLFRISKGQYDYPSLVLPPVTVHAIHNPVEESMQYSLTDHEAKTLAKRNAYEPQPLPITIPRIAPQTHTLLIPSTISGSRESLFLTSDTKYLIESMDAADILIPLPRLELSVSGPLRAVATFHKDLPIFTEMMTLPIDRFIQERYIYNVLVDNSTGKVIWFEKLGDHSLSYESASLEEILLALNFEVDSQALVTQGLIEMTTTRSTQDCD